MKTIFEEMGGSYSEIDGYMIPNLCTIGSSVLHS